MTCRKLLPALAFAALALPAQALDLNQMSDAEREAFRAEIRAYLLENPEIILEAIDVLEQREAALLALEDQELVKANADALFSDGHSWVGGNPEGDITLVEFMDYRCGYCRRAVDEVHGLIEDDGNIRFVIKEFPILGEQSLISSRFAIATQQVAGDEAYKSVHDALLALDGEVNETSLRRVGDSLGLDTDAILAHMDSDAVSDVITANHALGQQLKISGTPSFVMGDRMLRGYAPQEAMQQMANDIRSQ